MKRALKNLFDKLGIDGSIAFSISNRFVQALGSLLVIYFISKYLTKEEQGYYYTFSSMAALQVFFELGLSVVITQFVAHEFAFTSLTTESGVKGETIHIARMASLFRFILEWYAWGALLLFCIVTLGGFVFFNVFGDLSANVSWQSPWILLMLATSLNLFISPYIPFLEGLNQVKEVAKFRTFQSVISYGVLFLSIGIDFGLWSLGLFALSNFITLLFWTLTNQFRKTLKVIWNSFDSAIVVSWKKEILPFQWRIALSWLSGYFIFQVFNPIVFALEGPVIAGQMGITLTAFSGISVIAMAWISTKIPVFSILIAQRKYAELDVIFFKALKQSFFLITIAVFMFVVTLGGLQFNYLKPWQNIGLRFLPVNFAIFIALTTIVNQIIFSMAAYLRSHKEEPLLANSIVGAILTIVLGYFSTHWYGIGGMVIFNFVSTFLIGFGWVTYVFVTKRKEWHT